MAAPQQKKQSGDQSSGGFLNIAIIVGAVLIGYLIYYFILGNPANFVGGKPENMPLEGNLLGTMYHGGILVPWAIGLLIVVISFSVERFLTIQRARGKSQIETFSRQIRANLASGNIDGALAACDKQKGSVANVVRQGLKKYQEMAASTEFNKEQKLLNIQKEIEEAIALELPMMEKNLVILSTISSIATLVGLLGTVFGMIKAFAALANSGAPDASALSLGISEALVNTALGIGTSCLAILAYNFFTTKIDKLTYAIDETGYSIAQTFAASHK